MSIDASEAGHRLADLHGDYLFEDCMDGSLSEPERVFMAVWRFQAEIYNGGLLQMFSNSTGDYVPFICHSLKTIGAQKPVSIIENAIKEIGSYPPYSHEMQTHFLESNEPGNTGDRLFALDRQIGEDIDEISVTLFRYLSQHRARFDKPDEFWEQGALQ